MLEELAQIQAEALAEAGSLIDETALEEFRLKFLGKKGKLTAASAGMRNVAKEDKPAVGQKLNEVRNAITGAVDSRKQELIAAKDAEAAKGIDMTLPGRPLQMGGVHPLTRIQEEAVRTLRRMGFALATGPEVETEWHCFDALNTPEDHPARNEKDTFYFDTGHLLRTHTSTVQIRTMEAQAPPVRVIAPGSAFRRDEIDATHLSAFTQIEGLYVAQDVRLADLKGTLEYFLRSLFGDTELRFRPHFFPFTEPSYEIDVKLGGKWLEMAGCGMVDPAVFEEVCRRRGDDVFHPDKVTGFAFGAGLERLTMVKYQIQDIRLLIENDARFLAQFA